MGWLLRHNWLWALLAFLLGAAVTWFLLVRREQSVARVATDQEAPVEEKSDVLVGATVGTTTAEATARTTGPAPAKHVDDPPDEVAVEAAAVEVDEPTAAEPPVVEEPAPAVAVLGERVVAKAERPAFSRRMEPNGVSESAAPTLFDDPAPAAVAVPEQAVETSPATADAVPDEVAPGRFGEGSADAVPHQGPPDGFTIKGNSQSMLFHPPDSPYYGRTKPEVWFRAEADAERAGFTKYVRRPRKSSGPEK